MRMVDLINKKKEGKALSKEEIAFIVEGFTKGEIPEYQMSAFLMAVYFKGMNQEETAELTLNMAKSGDTVDLSEIKGVKVDKHSTGGVGDKTTLIISPIVASLGVPVAKMSGRGLGHTGGTVDKLESIPGFKTSLSREEFLNIVKKDGLCVAGQSGNLAPADKKIYALRDVTGTVDNLSLIASSIMSKKIAAGADAILLDVKTGSGAFMKTPEASIALAKEMVNIGEAVGRHTVALITDMDIPLGFAIGNSLEIIESVDTLKGNGPEDLTEVCLAIASEMLYLAGKGSVAECRRMAEGAIKDGSAFKKLAEMVSNQGGDPSVIEDTENFQKAGICHTLLSTEEGYIHHMDVEGIGISSSLLGAGREREDSVIDFSAGILLNKKTGDYVKKDEVLAHFYTNDENKLKQGIHKFLESIEFSKEKPGKNPLIYARVSKDGVENRA
jgi:pyrimidine-nucleoside phosphorylase